MLLRFIGKFTFRFAWQIATCLKFGDMVYFIQEETTAHKVVDQNISRKLPQRSSYRAAFCFMLQLLYEHKNEDLKKLL